MYFVFLLFLFFFFFYSILTFELLWCTCRTRGRLDWGKTLFKTKRGILGKETATAGEKEENCFWQVISSSDSHKHDNDSKAFFFPTFSYKQHTKEIKNIYISRKVLFVRVKWVVLTTAKYFWKEVGQGDGEAAETIKNDSWLPLSKVGVL